MQLLKPQYSLRWIFVEMTLIAIALGCFAYFFRNPHVYKPVDMVWPFGGFFLTAGAAVGGLFHWHVVGGFVGWVVAGILWPFLVRGLSS